MIRKTRVVLVAGVLLVVTLGLALSVNGCAGTGPEDLPEDEGQIQVLDPQVAPLPTTPERPAARTPAETPEEAPEQAPPTVSPKTPVTPLPPPGPFQRLSFGKVKGGQLVYEVTGSPAEVAAMFVDYDGADGHRSWAERYRVISRENERVVAEWQFRGKMGVSPTVNLEFRTQTKDDGYRIRYKLAKKAFGIASFFGDYRIVPVSTEPPRSRVTQRVFIDSGLPFVNADYQDLEDGLRADARLIRAWMESRTRAGR